MANFNYLAQDGQNKQIRGALEAKNIAEAKTKLRQSGFYIIWIRQEGRFFEKFSFVRIKNLDVAVFSHQFSVMISSGIPLIRALKAMADEASNKSFAAIINKIRFDVENGASLSDALLRHPKIFSNFFINLIKAGEAGGILPTVLNRLANHLEKEEDLRRKIASSFAYTLIVGIVAVGVVAFLLIFIVPVFRSVYNSLKIQLPGPTLALIYLSNIATKFWWLVLLLAGLSSYAYKMLKRNVQFSLSLDKLKLNLPMLGQLNRKLAVSRFVRTFSTLISSGVSLGQSLLIVREIVDNRYIAGTIDAMQKDITKGASLTESLKGYNIFPPMVLQMMSAGEESGRLEAMLDKCADFLDEDIDSILKSLVVKIEPILTFFLAGFVGFIALAMYLPMFDLIRQLGK